MRRDETAISLLALGLGLTGAVLLTFLPLSLGVLARLVREGAGSPLQSLLALGPALVAAGVCGWFLRLLARANRPPPEAPVPRARAIPDARQEARARLLELAAQSHFTLSEALAKSGLERLDLETLLDDLLRTGDLKAELLEGRIVYRRPP